MTKESADRKTMNSNQFRKELIKIMPGYAWTIHHSAFAASNYFSATGIQSSGFNRLSTLKIIRRESNNGNVEYEVTSSGYGTRSPWLSEYKDQTLARALRGLQNHYESMGRTYSSLASSLEYAREKHNKSNKSLDSGAREPAQVS